MGILALEALLYTLPLILMTTMWGRNLRYYWLHLLLRKLQILREIRWLAQDHLARTEYELRLECGSFDLIPYFSLYYGVSDWAENNNYISRQTYHMLQRGYRAVREVRWHSQHNSSEPGWCGGRGSQTLIEKGKSREETGVARGKARSSTLHIWLWGLSKSIKVGICLTLFYQTNFSYNQDSPRESCCTYKAHNFFMKIFLKWIA